MTYTPSQGPVSNDKPIIVEAFRNAELTDVLAQPNKLLNNGAPYSFLLLESLPHYLRAYLDLNNNGSLDPGEPFTIYNGKSAPPGDPIPGDGSMVDLSFGDLPSPCIGDCNADGAVTIDEILPCVNIALGEVEVSECPAFDPNGSGTVTVDELLEGVNNALNGCGGM